MHFGCGDVPHQAITAAQQAMLGWHAWSVTSPAKRLRPGLGSLQVVSQRSVSEASAGVGTNGVSVCSHMPVSTDPASSRTSAVSTAGRQAGGRW
jgi:hypothetical protein